MASEVRMDAFEAPRSTVSSRVGVVVLVKHPCLQRERMQSSAPNQMTTGSPTTYTTSITG